MMEARRQEPVKDDKKIELLNIIQENFPIDKRPFKVIGDRLGLSEEEALELVKELKKEGYIRRIGGVFDSRKLGYYSTLCTAKVPEEKIDKAAQVINSYDGVTHNYIRNNQYNMWFTVIAPSKEDVESFISSVKEETGIEDIINLPAVDSYKIRVNFDIKE